MSKKAPSTQGFSKITQQSYARRQLEEWLQEMDIAADSVADVGGRKNPIKNRVRSWQVQRYDIFDLPEYDLNQEWNLKEDYDVAFCLEVFEYIYNPVLAMKNLHQMLKKGGVLYTSFHFLYPPHGPQGMDYLRYTRWGVEKLLLEVGFSKYEIRPRKLKLPFLVYILYICQGLKKLLKSLHLFNADQGYLVKAIK